MPPKTRTAPATSRVRSSGFGSGGSGSGGFGSGGSDSSGVSRCSGAVSTAEASPRTSSGGAASASRC
ncbi:hypothetical protein E3N84_06705 [Terrimesophilobacter mesophilus]|uniref:Uncharacterized protein n=1 Tax=Terrimesophilobacter mesophilus TaxID=433647 RepID=A0A4R8VD49_9MICO|nr:hypothetical protein E3N84_06705 [Terrimesophilobacter mesophilus]